MHIKHRNYLFILVGFLLVISPKTHAQHKNDFEAGIYNIGFGGIIGGIGAIINKKPNENTGKVFLKGLYQGALGGYLVFESKRLVGKFSKTGNYGYIWPSKLVNSAGVSIIENAAANRIFWKQWHINIGFNRFEFYTQDKFKVSYRIMPFALVNVIYGFTQGELDANKSIKVGSFVFIIDEIKTINDFSPDGQTRSNTILLKENPINKPLEILSHELIHVYQYESFSGMNPFLVKPISNLYANKKWSKIYNKIFYTDFNYISKALISAIDRSIWTEITYKNRLFEKEANYYTRF